VGGRLEAGQKMSFKAQAKRAIIRSLLPRVRRSSQSLYKIERLENARFRDTRKIGKIGCLKNDPFETGY
jgi:hypothetical protein